MQRHAFRRFLVEDGIRHLILAPLAFLIVFPIVWMVLTSLKPSAETVLWPPRMLPQAPTFENYREVFLRWPFLRFFLNSLLVSGVSTVMVLLTSSSAGYAFAKIKSRAMNVIFFIFIATIIVPFESYMIPVYLLVNRLGWLDSYPGLILPFIIMAFGVFFMRQFFLTLPKELGEAAKIDGAGHYRTFALIMMPQAVAPMAALAIFVFQHWWNDFFWANVFLYSEEKFTLPLGLVRLQGLYGTTPTVVVFAAIAVVSVPILIVFVFTQKYLTESLARTGLGG